ncbi:dTDP-glucose 4,6-dehydratase [Clostridium rectalis]|uniref:dTDP-glucose 4,6-dehydratase n=1 Tax=Clostridium rectalis TaxID=2040295 RepID=UPI000F6432F3|nr:dTDP-glucose 4,6-dehydratase [Clostridium rectalis]
MKTYFITGGAGFIGANFIIYMFKKYKGIRIINYDKLTYVSDIKNLKCIENNNNYIFIKGDICDKKKLFQVFQNYSIDYVINFAAESSVIRSIEDPEEFIKTNIQGTFNLLSVFKKYWEEEAGGKDKIKYLQISKDEVYGSLGRDGYFTESSYISPTSPYSASKTSADMIVKSYYDTYGLPINITRCSNNYGPFQHIENFIPMTIFNCIKGLKVPIYGDGLNVRDWIYVEDHLRAIDMVLEKGECGHVYNVGCHNEKSNIDVVMSIIKLLNEYGRYNIKDNVIYYIKDRLGHDKRYAIDPSKLYNLGWRPYISFEEGLKNTVIWYIKKFSN